jgi:TolB-like protein
MNRKRPQMSEKSQLQRKLTAILSADVFGYSRLMGADQEDTFSRLTACREIIFRRVRENEGKVSNTAGDAVLAQFASVNGAVAAAIEIQKCLADLNKEVPEDRQMHFRIGINLGDVIELDGDIFGDGVNIAARLQALASPGGIMISDSVHDQIKGRMDAKSEYFGEQKVKNIDHPVRVYRIATGVAEAVAPVVQVHAEPSSSELAAITIGVLPFDNLSDDIEQTYFSDGLVEDLITTLSTFPELKIIARNTMYGFKGKSPDIRQLGRDLGATYIVEGSVRKSGNRIRVSAQLIETASGIHKWAKRYDKELRDLFELQDDLVRNIITELDVQLVSGEQARVYRASVRSPEAYDLAIHARSLANRENSPRALLKAIDLVDQALAIDPSSVLAHMIKAVQLARLARGGIVSDPAATLRQAYQLMETAIRLDEHYPTVHTFNGYVLMVGDELDQAEKEFERGLSLGPALRSSHSLYAVFCFRKREPQRAFAEIRRAKELSPHAPEFLLGLEARVLSFVGRNEEALALLKRAMMQYSSLDLWVNSAYLSSVLKQHEEFESALKRIGELQPDFDPEIYFRIEGWADKKDEQAYAEHFRPEWWK